LPTEEIAPQRRFFVSPDGRFKPFTRH